MAASLLVSAPGNPTNVVIITTAAHASDVEFVNRAREGKFDGVNDCALSGAIAAGQNCKALWELKAGAAASCGVAGGVGCCGSVVMIHGGMGREDRKKAEESFKHDPDVQVLLATDAAGEGINLQRAHLMVNYDLPWNPNRIEQRFGRIHRIAQTEVCHLWNLVAQETREGDVYHVLLDKLAEARETLGGQVFDVLGKIQFEGKALRELLIEAVRYGERPEVRARLSHVVAHAFDRSQLEQLIEERALVHDAMDASRVYKIREEMERAEARRLQPHYIESFFLEAFSQLGGTVKAREPRRYEVTHVPATVRNRDRLIGTGQPVLHRYERVAFEKSLIAPQGQPMAAYLCPGHPLARTIYLGSAPTATAAHRGIEDRRIKLGCVMPGESPAVFGDALRRLATAATYLYQDGARYWYSTQPTVKKIAEDRAEQLTRDPDKVAQEIEARIRMDVRKTGDFRRVHPLPTSGQDVPDETDARLVVLGLGYPYSKEPNCAAITQAKAILEMRGNSPRLFRNALAFLAIDQSRLQDLDEAVRWYLAWDSIVDEKESLDLAPHQVKQAVQQRESAGAAVTARLPEAYQWLIVPAQTSPQSETEWQAFRLSGQDGLAVRAGKELVKKRELLHVQMAGTVLRMELDKVPLWRGEHVEIKQLVDDFGRYVYLPRLLDSQVLVEAIRDGLSLLTWQRDTFAYADSFDESQGRYRGLRGGAQLGLNGNAGLLVKPEAARRQMAAEEAVRAAASEGAATAKTVNGDHAASSQNGSEGGSATAVAPPPQQLRRFHGTVALDPTRVGRDAGRIADEVIAHLAGLVGLACFRHPGGSSRSAGWRAGKGG